jgi:hypothetical protein
MQQQKNALKFNAYSIKTTREKIDALQANIHAAYRPAK